MRGGFVWDDDAYVTSNEALRSLDGLRRIWFEPGAVPQYYPLTYTTFWLEYRLWGLEPTGYHVVNVLLHGLAAILVWRLLARLRIPGAWLAAAIFALHPIHVESVAWMTERKNVLAGVLYLGAALAYFHAFEPAAHLGTERRWGTYVLATTLFAFALLSKSVTASLPAALLLLVWWQRGRLRMRDLRPLLPWVGLALPMGLVTVWMERHNEGAIGAEWTLSAVERCLVAGRAVWFYATKLAWPRDLMFNYPRWEIDATAWWQYVFPAAAVAVMAALYAARARLGRGPLTSVLYFVGTLVPALGFFDVYPMRYSFVADHFVYLASLGLIALTAAGVASIRLGPRGRRVRAVVCGVGLAGLGALAWRQGWAYESETALWEDTLRKNPASWMAHNNLGTILHRDGHLEEAAAHYREAVRLKPDSASYANLGNLLVLQGKTAEATGSYEKALELAPGLPEVHNSLGRLLHEAGALEQAIGHYRLALAVAPEFAEAHLNLGAAFASAGRNEEAIRHLSRAVSLEPRDFNARSNLGTVLVLTGQPDAAILQLSEAVRLQPANVGARYNLGVAFARVGRRDEAIASFAEVARQDPSHANARHQLGMALAEEGQLEDAETHLRAALRLRPDWPRAQIDLAWLIATTDTFDSVDSTEAIGLAERAVSGTAAADATTLDALAAIYARAGRFAEARQTAQQAIDVAVAAGQPQLAAEIHTRLLRYGETSP